MIQTAVMKIFISSDIIQISIVYKFQDATTFIVKNIFNLWSFLRFCMTKIGIICAYGNTFNLFHLQWWTIIITGKWTDYF